MWNLATTKVKLFKEKLKLNSKWWFNDYRMRYTFLLRPSQNKTNKTNGLLKAFFEFFDLSVIFNKTFLPWTDELGIRVRWISGMDTGTSVRPTLVEMVVKKNWLKYV